MTIIDKIKAMNCINQKMEVSMPWSSVFALKMAEPHPKFTWSSNKFVMAETAPKSPKSDGANSRAMAIPTAKLNTVPNRVWTYCQTILFFSLVPRSL